jgi:hypothetical protein
MVVGTFGAPSAAPSAMPPSMTPVCRASSPLVTVPMTL